MNGAQDLGGRHGFGPIGPEENEPPFHDEWERRVFALTLAMGFTGQWNIDKSRHARESMDPAHYLSSSYFQIWLEGLTRLLLNAELVSREELDAGQSLNDPAQLTRILTAEEAPASLARGGPADRETDATAAFAEGDAVRARNIQPPGHTRLPGYARGRQGVVARVHGCHVFPDANARGEGERPQWLYSVRFTAQELFGETAPPGDEVHIDMWESYLDAV
ncbi:MAG: nitrile hydratase subunit beta [Hyphomicrobiales bacterium]